MKHIFNQLLLPVVVLVLISGCTTMNSRWKDTSSINTIAAYREFLHRYPEGELADKAHSRIEKLYFEQARAEDSITAYKYFLHRYPEGELADKARLRIKPLWFQRARHTNTIKGYETFLHRYPEGELADKVRMSLQLLKDQIQQIREAAKSVLTEQAKVRVKSALRYPNKHYFVVYAYLLQANSAWDGFTARFDYGTRERLTKLVKYRCAKVLKSIGKIAKDAKLPDASAIAIVGKIGGGTKENIYNISITIDEIKKHDWLSIKEEEIMELWKVDRNIIYSLRLTHVPAPPPLFPLKK